jgi:DNA-binding transcriptional ArsR family regulator
MDFNGMSVFIMGGFCIEFNSLFFPLDGFCWLDYYLKKMEAHNMIRWQLHTAYDFFISLYVIFHPRQFGLRASWAAGVRQRMDDVPRRRLGAYQAISFVPLKWLATLPEQGDVRQALDVLAGMPPQERFHTLFLPPQLNPDVRQSLERLGRGEPLDTAHKAFIRTHYRHSGRSLREEELETLFAIWRDPASHADQYLALLRAYHEVFFLEEEQRIFPYLEKALQEARLRSEKSTLIDLLTYLSRGVRAAALDHAREVVLAPSFWSAPLVFFTELREGAHVFVFGARPDNVPIIPGGAVPDDLVLNLKALANSTRLRILKMLIEEPATATELSRKLRLRPPTLVHHLRALRLAGLVQITVDTGYERVYAFRAEGLFEIQQALTRYLDRN